MFQFAFGYEGLETINFSRNILGHFRQRSDIFGKSSKIFVSGCYVFGNHGRDETKISHI